MSDINSVRRMHPLAPVSRQLAAAWPTIAAVVLALTVLYVVGFGGPQTIHNAAHDARHSLNFPCH